MRRKFADITITPSRFDPNSIRELILKASILDYKLVGFNIHATKANFLPIIQEAAKGFDLDIVSRVDVTFEKQWLIKKHLQKYRRKVELISLRGINRAIISFGCRDRRIDIISLDPDHKFTLFKGDIANILEQGKVLELTARPLIFADNIKKRVRALQQYEKIIKLALHKGIKTVFGSGATTCYELRDAGSLASIMVAFFDVSYKDALDSLSKNIFEIVERNRFKLSKRFIWPGVYISSKSEKHD